MDGQERADAAQVEEERRGVFQFDLERVVVGRVDADLREIREVCVGVVEALPVLEVVELVGVLGGVFGGEDAPPCVDEIGRGDALAVGPAGVAAEVEGVTGAIGRNFPAFGDAGDGFASAVEGRQALEEGVGDAHVDLCDDQRGVERFDLRAVGEDEVRARGRFGAAGGEPGQQQGA